MSGSRHVPDAFDAVTVVVLRRAPNPPEMTESELDDLQAAHLAYRFELFRQGSIVVNGPFVEQTDDSYRGMSIFACGPDEASRLSDGDPSVAAGRLVFDVMEWWYAAGLMEFPQAQTAVTRRRSWGDEPS